ncbi:ESP1 [[Candida] subhashii]|uniref:separase n=1 Tax=[Candida] subhashii TaxID=561895 RepID=A0A8J5UVQ5_9ASCO|nr:ESP1 [[Candida] subhashii]KAG7662390.1 ESP1 [[Candida] subhashii]
MKDISIDPKVLSFVQSQSTVPLSPSKRSNIPQHDMKALESSCLLSINTHISNGSAISNIQLMNMNFNCLYLIYQNNGELLIGIIKKHQLYVVKLLESKQVEEAINQLISIFQQICNVLDIKTSTIDVDTILLGVPHTDVNDDQIVQIVNSFHLFVLQSVLQYASKNFKSIITNTDSIVQLASLKIVPELFLHGSNFRKWLVMMIVSSDKYHRNCIKMLQGYIKVFSIIKLEKFAALKSCFQLKLMEYTKDFDKLDEIQVFPELIPYLNDSKSIPNIERLIAKLDPAAHSDILHLLENCTTIDAVHSLQIKLLGSAKLIDDQKLLKTMTTIKLRNDCVGQNLALALSSFFAHASTGSTSWSPLHLSVLDLLTIYARDSLQSNIVFTGMEQMLQNLYVALSKFKQLKRIRNLSNLSFNIGNRSNSSTWWQLSIRMECFIMDLERTEQNFKQLSSKFHRLANSIDDCSEGLKSFLKCNQTFVDKYDYEQIVHDKLTIQAICKMFTTRPELAVTLNALEDKFKSSITCRMFDVFERTNDAASKTIVCNAIMKNLSFVDEYYEQRVQYRYYDINGIDNYLQLSISSSANSLILAGFQVQKLMNFGWDELVLEECIYNVQSWLSHRHTNLSSFEVQILNQVLAYFKYNGLTGKIIQIIELCKNNQTLTPELLVLLDSELSQALTKLSLHIQCAESLTELNKSLKQQNLTTLREAINFNLLQLEYCIESKNVTKAREMFSKVLKTFQSRQEFKLDGTSKFPVEQRFQNFLLVGRFQLLAAKLNQALNLPVEAFLNAKLAIQLSGSVIKKSGPNIQKRTFNELKWGITHLLFQSYNMIVDLLGQLGISRDIPFYLREFKKVNDANMIPVVNCVNSFRMGIDGIIMKNESYREHLQSAENLAYEIVSGNFTTQQYRCFANSLLRTAKHEEVQYPKFSSWQDIPFLNNLYELESNKEIEWKYLYGTFLNIPVQIESNNKDVLSQVIDFKNELAFCETLLSEHALLTNMKSTVKFLPAVCQGTVHPTPQQIEILNKLVGLKSRILSVSTIRLPIFVYRDLTYLLHRCLCLISSMTIFKNDGNLLEDVYFRQDWLNTTMFNNERELNENDRADLLPKHITEPNIKQLDEMCTNFHVDLNLYLPSSWSIVTIDICSHTGDLLISKIKKGNSPVYVRLPLSRFDTREPTEKVLTFEELKDKFNTIIQESDLSTKQITTSKVVTKEDRKSWWKLRFGLDYRLESILNYVEKYWIGGFSGLFANFDEGTLFTKFRSDLLNLLARYLPTRIGQSPLVEFDDAIIRSIYCLERYSREAVDDLLYFLIDNLKFHGENNEYDSINFEKLHASFKLLIDKYNSLRFKNSKEHLVLIPSSKCSFFPWESLGFLKSKSVTRMPSVSMLIELLKSQSNLSIEANSDLYYLINPGGDLVRSEERFKQYFESKGLWKGIVGRKPDPDMILQDITNSQLFIYIGHGGCDQYFRVNSLFKMCLKSNKRLPPSLLLGCSSGVLQDNGLFEPSGNIYNWLICKAPMVLVNLWDVTDKDIDTFTMSVFENWGLIHPSTKTVDFAEAVKMSRDRCTLNYLNGAAPVVYGLPLMLE